MRINKNIYKRAYFQNYERYQELDNADDLVLERFTHHISDGEKKVATLDQETGSSTLYRYQYGNNLGSVGLELDDSADIISYEEYYPFGGTAYYAHNSAIDVPLKRYKYCGKEQDEETGLYYYGARYYAPWLCRFSSVDPKALEYVHQSSYVFADNNPVVKYDVNGEGTNGDGTAGENQPLPIQNQKMSNDATSVAPVVIKPVAPKTEKKYPMPSLAVQKQPNDKTNVATVKPQAVMTKEQKAKLDLQNAAKAAMKQDRGEIKLPSTDIRSKDFQNNLNPMERVASTDPVIKAVATGGAVVFGGIVAAPLILEGAKYSFSGSITARAAAAGTNTVIQMTTVKSINELNVASAAAAFAMPQRSLLPALTGNLFKVTGEDISKNNVGTSTILTGKLDLNEALIGTVIDATFNKLGNMGSKKLMSDGIKFNETFSSTTTGWLSNSGAAITNLLKQSYLQQMPDTIK